MKLSSSPAHDFTRTINHIFKAYEPYRGAIDTGRNGSLISMASGETSGYAIAPLQARGTMFIQPSCAGKYFTSIIQLASKPLRQSTQGWSSANHQNPKIST